MNAARKPNRLANEKSPYLLQHALNPVDWYPWIEEAFEKARKEDKPIFLSIGYSTCHWCHVMEKESFEDEEVAKILKENFVAIKVDREERPDIDSIYMKACVLISGSGGWPLTIIMTPQKQPFLAGTYFPRNSRAGLIGLVDLLKNVAELWKKERRKLVETSERVTEHLKGYVKTKQRKEELTEMVLDEAFIGLLDNFDKVNGGFGTRPKFPSPHNLFFLLRYWDRKGRRQALEIVEKTLLKMRLGGVFDQVGFGFHRYSTDSKWLVPHFEKMLYDQALMSIVYTEAYQATAKIEYRKTAEEIFEYILRDMTNLEGGFFSAEDADSEGQEGKFYLWTETEIKKALGKNADLAINVFNISKGGNYYDEAHQAKTGKNILHLRKPLQELTVKLNINFEKLTGILERVRRQLYEIREKRIHPLRDTKILTEWNGLMIAALAKGARAFGSTEYLEIAEKTIMFILEKLQTGNGRLLHRYVSGETAIDGNLNDYSFLIWGLIELYEATFKTKYLKEALRLQEDMIERFWDREGDGFFFTASDGEKLLIRNKEFHDGAIPSGNSVALLNLIRLARMTGKVHYEEKAAALAKAFSAHMKSVPSQNTMFLAGLDFLIGPASEIVIVGNQQSKEAENLLKTIRKRFIPRKVILFKEEHDKKLESLADFTKSMKKMGGKTAVYICRNFVCNKPTTDKNEVLEWLTNASSRKVISTA